ncbi:hypothetical protein I3842_15G060100 [Carya illinoinensis]|uniref:Alpha/beta hydrolase fold-3 domain-containing protein n=1 Tax=Carya illinoinensis TaxID=32201 RepID=A0A922D683_CARIL|nr:hypothetical protein I3842_15G060100 [Carya illinoinensis]
MEPSKPEIAYEFPGMLRIYKDGRVERLMGTDFVPASTDLKTGVMSKDIKILSEFDLSARLFLPKLTKPNQKLPLVIYFHGGGFCVGSPFTSRYNSYLNAIVAEANIVVVSVSYRLAPENPLPAAYEDARAALQWIGSHCGNVSGPEAWLNEHVDFERVFLAGLSAGANIVHNLAIAAGEVNFGLKVGILGVVLEHPYFWGSNPIGSEAHLDLNKKALVDRLWPLVCPYSPDNDGPQVNPVAKGAPSLVGLGCKRVLVCVAEKDMLRDRGWLYYEALGRSGWKGSLEIKETEGEDHAFYLNDLESEKAKDLIKHLAAFYNNKDMPTLI